MTQTIAIGQLTWDMLPARRPSTNDYNGIALEEDPINPADPSSMPTAGLLNNQSLAGVGYGAVVPNLTMSIRYSGGAPIVDSFASIKGAAAPAPTSAPFVTGSQWASATAFAQHSFITPTVGNGFYYQATAIAGTGTSGSVQPTWPTTIGQTVVDNAGANQITWTCIGPSTNILTLMRTPGGSGSGDLFLYWTAGALPPATTRSKAFLNGSTPALAPAIDVFTDSNSNAGVRVKTQNASATQTDLPITLDVM